MNGNVPGVMNGNNNPVLCLSGASFGKVTKAILASLAILASFGISHKSRQRQRRQEAESGFRLTRRSDCHDILVGRAFYHDAFGEGMSTVLVEDSG